MYKLNVHVDLCIEVISMNMTNRYEMVIWVPNVVAFIVMVCISGKHLTEAPLSSPSPVKASVMMTFGATLAATVVSYSTMTPDYGVYHNSKATTCVFRYILQYLPLLIASRKA